MARFKGKKHTSEAKKKTSIAVSQELTGKFGKKARRWKGNNAGYAAIHIWLSKHFNKGNSCNHCGITKVSRLEWANISKKYKRTRNDWLVLCPSCHRRYDIGNVCKRGHEFTKENTYLRKEGWRVCRACGNERQRKYEKRNKVNKV